MIEKALSSLFRVIQEEAASNPAFGRRLEDALGSFAEEYGETRRTERRVAGFHPFVEFKTDAPEEFRGRLMKFEPAELRMVMTKHNLDPTGSLRARRTSKKALVDHILAAAQKRAERDAKMFEY
ncbi:MAG: hypothetical protein SGJ21_03885 [Alphaproteobacteria bacterium]|nr:hypothetical protein [Alphaproteobacteria bacterium]